MRFNPQNLRNTILILIFAVLLSFPSTGQQKPEVRLNTPQQTLTTFLENLTEENYQPKNAAKIIAPSQRKTLDEESLTIQLKQILDGAGIEIELDEVPNTADYFDSTENKSIYSVAPIEFPDIYLEKMNGKWYVSKKTIQKIASLHRTVYPFGTDKLLNILPKLGHQKFLGLHAWQHISILILIILCVIVHRILTLLFDKLLYKILNRRGYKDIAHNYILPVARPFSWAVVVTLLIVFVPVLQLPITVNHYLVLILNATVPVFATIMAYKIVDIIGEYMLKVAERTESTMDDQIVPILKRVLKIFVVIVGILFVLSKLRYDITALLAGISIGGLAFALAAQETIKNFFGSLMILFDKPFQIGDWITAGDIDGTVEEVGFRSTRVRTFRNSVISVPNGKLADMSIDNHGLREYRRFFTNFTLTYDTPNHLIETFIEGLKDLIERHPDTRKDFYIVRFNNMSAFSLDIMFYIFFKVPDWLAEMRAREEILLQARDLAKQLGVQFAFPTQTLHMENFPGQESLSPSYRDEQATSKQLEEFLKLQSQKKT